MKKKNLTAKDVLSIPQEKINKMTASELKKLVSVLAPVANKRLSRLEKEKLKTPAYKSAMKSGGKFSSRGEKRKDIAREFYRVKDFLNKKSSTVQGAKKIAKDFMSRLGMDSMPTMDEQIIAWDIITKMNEIFPAYINNFGSTRFQSYIFERVHSGYDSGAIMNIAEEELEAEYEARETVEYGHNPFDFGGYDY